MLLNKLPKPGFLVLFVITVFPGCGFISLEMLELTVYPDTRNQLISEEERVWIEFSIPPDRERVEPLFTVLKNGAPLGGDYTWEGNRLLFTPVPAFKPGIRYLASFEGDFISETGIPYPAHFSVPFYAGAAGPPPVLLRSLPDDGETCTADTDLEFRFSASLAETALFRGFSITPDRKVKITRKGETGTVIVSAEEGWEPHTVYTWEFAETVTDLEGRPLGGSRSGTFVTQADTTPPRVLSVSPASYLGGAFLEQSGFGRDDVIKIVFSEEIDLHSLRSAFSITPHLPGRFGKTGGGEYIYFPEIRLSMYTEYILAIDTNLCDESGNYLENPYHFSILPDIPEQRVESVRFIETAPPIELNEDDFCSRLFPEIGLAGAEPDLSQTIEIIFARPYEEPYRSRFAEHITCTGYFPAALFDPELEVASWDETNTRLLLKYNGFEHSPAGIETRLYKLTIPGGPPVSENREGSFIPEETWIVFRTAE